MATKLNKPVIRQVELNDEVYFASLDPCNGAPSFTLRKARTRDTTKLQMESCLDIKPDPPVRQGNTSGSREQIVNELKDKIVASDINYLMKVDILNALIDILEVDRLLLQEGAEILKENRKEMKCL